MDRVIWMILVWIGHMTTHGVAAAPCIYGNDTHCFYQCHCSKKSECGGVCTSGCNTSGTTPEIRWTGSTCQIGNIALSKPTNQTSTYGNLVSSKAVDGFIEPVYSYCAHSGDQDQTHHWWLDLRGVFKIYNITIYRRTDCSSSTECRGLFPYLNSFTLGVVDDQNQEIECARYNNTGGDGMDFVISLTCHPPLTGRYVHFVRENTGFFTAFCEVVVIGHKYTDCQYCPSDCNEVTGCTECIGAYQPDCKIGCDDGFYGTNCERRCGNCNRNAACNKRTGVCPHDCEDGFYGTKCNRTCGKCSDMKCNQADGLCKGCQMWWTDNKCMTMIALPIVINETITGSTSSNKSLTIEWRSLTSIPDSLVKFYQYEIKYKVNNTADYVNTSVVKHTTMITQSYVIKGLRHNTVYDVIITPERAMSGQVEANPDNRRYGPVSIKTKCNVPDLSTLDLDVIINKVEESFPRILLSYDLLWVVNHGCDSIQTVVLKYNTGQTSNMLQMIPNNTTFEISPSAWGHYDIELTVTNNQGLSSTIYKTVELVDPRATSTTVITPETSTINTIKDGISGEITNTYVYIVAVLAVLLAGCIIVTVTRYRSTRKEILRLRAEISDLKVKVKQEPVIRDDDTAVDYEAIKLETRQEESSETTAYETLRDQSNTSTELPPTYEVM